MISWALDANNNLIRDVNGQFKTVDRGAEVVQHVRSRLLFYLGEAPLNTALGVDYKGAVLVKAANLPRIESILKTEILRSPGVAVLLDFGLDYNSNTRRLSVSFEAQTTFGSVEGATLNFQVSATGVVTGVITP